MMPGRVLSMQQFQFGLPQCPVFGQTAFEVSVKRRHQLRDSVSFTFHSFENDS